TLRYAPNPTRPARFPLPSPAASGPFACLETRWPRPVLRSTRARDDIADLAKQVAELTKQVTELAKKVS
ncbi:hypothetical protein KBZ21_51285, partial [Streptomyces sp. A73]|nr:hypothetical protein [Streptomyces sp. A73]